MALWTSWLNSGSPGRFELPGVSQELGELRERMVAVLEDCHGPAAERLRTRLQRARTASDLWLARCDMYQLIANQHCEGQAVQRINGLVPAFEGRLPPRMLRAV
jgi:hypothetical protein